VLSWIRHLARRALLRRGPELLDVLDNLAEPVAVLTPDGIVQFANAAYRTMLGHAPATLLGASILDLIHPEDHERVARCWRDTGAPSEPFEFRFRHRDGSWRLVEGVVHNRRGEAAMGGILLVSHDVEMHRSAHAALRDSERRYQALTTVSPVGIFHTDAAGDCLQVNERWQAISGRSEGDSLGRGLIEAVHPLDRERIHGEFTDALAARRMFRSEYRLQRPDGSVSWVIGQATPQWEGPERFVGYIGTVTDISDRKHAEEALRESENFLRTIFDTEPECVKLISRDGTIQRMNKSGLRMLEATSDEDVVGRCVSDFIVEGHRAAVQAHIELVFGGESVTVEFDMQGLRGTRRTMESHVVPFRDGADRVVAALAITRDITSRRLLEEQLRQSQGLDALGKLAGGIAHDFNNLLTVIRGRSEILLRRMAPGDPHFRELELIRSTCASAGDLIRRLLVFGRKQVLDTEPTDLNVVVGNLMPLVRRAIGEDVSLQLSLSDEPLCVRVDRTQIEQVITNLVLNARDAMPTGGRIILGTAAVTTGGNEAGLPSGRYAVFTVRDNGCGMDAQTRRRIFEPFFTTKEGRGTGLGLSTVYGIVTQHRGRIDVTSAPGEGATFVIHLPRIDVSAETVARREETVTVRGGDETVLLVEDEAAVRDVVADVLEAAGYRVVPMAAADVVARPLEEGRVDLLVSDVVMPLVSGPEVATAVRSQYPRVQVLYISGYPDEILERHGIDPTTVVLVAKPFSTEELLTKVREVLSRAPA
jgi:PAS domain S-box-containing protein